MNIKLPLIVLGYGDFVKNKKLLSIQNSHNEVMMPVFTDPELAEKYRKWSDCICKDSVLPISMLGKVINRDQESSYDDPNRVNAFILSDIKHAIEMFNAVDIIGNVTYVAINPPHPKESNEQILCYEIEEILEALENLKLA